MRFDKVLVANRGEIARRILRTCRDMGYGTVAVFSDADARAPFVHEADEAIRLGPAPSAESYLAIDRILDAARRAGAGAIHPGYGFLSENADLSAACEDAGIVFIGPRPETIRAMGSKVEAKRLMAAHGVPVIPGHDGDDRDAAAFHSACLEVGFPLLIKASAGGGGKGMRVVRSEAALADAIAAAKREAAAAFGDDLLLVERYVDRPRHVEIQILGDEHGHLVHCFERECSIQRRHQKIIEETPSVALDPDLRAAMCAAALDAGRALDYRSAGTVEFLLGPDRAFYFLEVNTRLQVEHPVTEMTTGLDLVQLQLVVAAGEPLPLTQDDIAQRGHAIECRIYSEDPANDFLPATGTIRDWAFEPAEGLRLDAGVEVGDEVSIHYDPMLAKVVTWGTDRAQATRRMTRALGRAAIQGTTTNQGFLLDVLRHEAWERGELHTHFIDQHFPPERRRRPLPDGVLARAAMAATLFEVERRRDEARILPGLPLGFRNNPYRDAERTFRVGEREVEVRYRQLGGHAYACVALGTEHRVEVMRRAEPALRLRFDDHVVDARVVAGDGSLFVHGPGGPVVLAQVSRFPADDNEVSSGSCRAPMPGRVLQVLVAAGDEVAPGQPLVVLEAMKMEHTLEAPRAGTVAEVLTEVGAQVKADAPLVVLSEP